MTDARTHGGKFFVSFVRFVVNFTAFLCLPERTQMTDLERLCHSASYVLATAILKIWPEAQFAAGAPVENGFYYDVDLPPSHLLRFPFVVMLGEWMGKPSL